MKFLSYKSKTIQTPKMRPPPTLRPPAAIVSAVSEIRHCCFLTATECIFYLRKALLNFKFNIMPSCLAVTRRVAIFSQSMLENFCKSALRMTTKIASCV